MKEWNPEEFLREQAERKRNIEEEKKSMDLEKELAAPLNPLRRESLSEEERLYNRCKERNFIS